MFGLLFVPIRIIINESFIIGIYFDIIFSLLLVCTMLHVGTVQQMFH